MAADERAQLEVIAPPGWAGAAARTVLQGMRSASLFEPEPRRPRQPRVAGVILQLEQLPTEQPAALATLTPAGWSYWTLDDWGHGLIWAEADAGDVSWTGTPEQLVEFVNRHVRPEQLRVFGG
jgi:hypothetical protein